MNDLERSTPGDMTMLLRLIDSKFETMSAKMDGLQQSLDTMNSLHKRFDARLDDHEARVQVIEQTMESRKVILKEYEDWKLKVDDNSDAITDLKLWKSSVETTTTNAKSWGGAIWGVLGVPVGAFVTFLIGLYVRAH